ncbi:hypothetical protein EJ03DRAFT_48202 [Teratosphaeria nubilosa]|uniref:Uncharacterized protein n=1 Tax=Teratosphaeria nubilosa TaxID=161662 RepID=A0A6G1KTJ1_9PEZI|nr:hypothetical protein EJ03DRAFT_48202 [Teratosphaeria nubilosa]
MILPPSILAVSLGPTTVLLPQDRRQFQQALLLRHGPHGPSSPLSRPEDCRRALRKIQLGTASQYTLPKRDRSNDVLHLNHAANHIIGQRCLQWPKGGKHDKTTRVCGSKPSKVSHAREVCEEVSLQIARRKYVSHKAATQTVPRTTVP